MCSFTYEGQFAVYTLRRSSSNDEQNMFLCLGVIRLGPEGQQRITTGGTSWVYTFLYLEVYQFVHPYVAPFVNFFP